jgi:hypothetical protein
MFPLVVPPFSGSFVFLNVGPSILFFEIPVFWVLWFIYDWQGFIMLMVGILILNGGKVLVLEFGFG